MDEPGMSFWEFRDRRVSWLGKMASRDVINTAAATGDGNADILKLLEAKQQRMQRMQDLLTKQQQLDSVRTIRSWEARRQPKHGYNAEGKRSVIRVDPWTLSAPLIPRRS
ncbi:hypothetical protein LSAT2_003015 [Lamellibrachia satsuma]|nr:hypothetical protein LSAT2_003015 [Lamellibrachia satsuma]